MSDPKDGKTSNVVASTLVFHLPRDEVHVWSVDLDVADWRDRLARLSGAESQRSERFAFERDRRRFVVCRAAVRAILGAYLAVRPCEVSFRSGPYGKPHLDPNRHRAPVCFNVSHSHDIALIAVSREREVGVDVEHVRALDGLDDIITYRFAPAERLALGRMVGAAKLSTFYRYWTLKEACSKASGAGMSEALGVDVSGLWHDSFRFPSLLGAGIGTSWTARVLDPTPGYVGALVVEGDGGACVGTMRWTSSGPAVMPLTPVRVPHTVMPSRELWR